MKRWILKTFFKDEMTALYEAHRDIEKAINSTHIKYTNRKIVNAKLSNWMRIFIAIHDK